MRLLGIEYAMAGTHWVKDILIGLLVGLGYLFLSSLLPSFFSLGQPRFLGLEQTTMLIIVLVLAPVLEELFFSGALRNLLIQGFNVNPLTVALIVAAAFAVFHVFAFTAGFYRAVQSPFLGAALFSLLMSATLFTFRTNNLLTPIAAHALINASTLSKLVLV